MNYATKPIQIYTYTLVNIYNIYYINLLSYLIYLSISYKVVKYIPDSQYKFYEQIKIHMSSGFFDICHEI